ncbi:hypothetical protein EVAR_93356_1 [Eumeta japonica]|uniref:Uncharacterized protein n=1 Tax=Eumeta variegata TaxID=151549 RepID=A0A4C1UTC1_EUMVA|nr:hypothetical protein EVAR_93356_1 [Eumeta japonica]
MKIYFKNAFAHPSQRSCGTSILPGETRAVGARPAGAPGSFVLEILLKRFSAHGAEYDVLRPRVREHSLRLIRIALAALCELSEAAPPLA